MCVDHASFYLVASRQGGPKAEWEMTQGNEMMMMLMMMIMTMMMMVMLEDVDGDGHGDDCRS